jgi:2,4-dienoyl-CoA reductase-like NADH-dependent reductase (Old Yellow Enzyme family)
MKLSDEWFDKIAVQSHLRTSKALKITKIDQAIEDWKRGARVSSATGFKGIQLHGSHGFLLSQFLSSHTNRRTDGYGYRRMNGTLGSLRRSQVAEEVLAAAVVIR